MAVNCGANATGWNANGTASAKAIPSGPVPDGEIAELESLLGTDSGDVGPKREFLDVVSRAFVARGFWLDPVTLRGAQPDLLRRGKRPAGPRPHATFPVVRLEGPDLLSVSTAVRERAAASKRR
jgi:hypothetical protein